MCGFAGFLDPRRAIAQAEWPALLGRMGSSLAHRGPDAEDHWVHEESAVGLVHRRLAILELSDAGCQPMPSASGRYVIAFNGEIYNHLQLREELGERRWRGHSDTETLLAAIEAWGIEGTLKASAGMFAFAIWDRHARSLTLARDRLGEKPLYYGWQGSVFLFGSELKALRVHPSFRGEVNRDALALFLRNNAIGAPHSIYRGIRKLLPGTLLTVARDAAPGEISAPTQYWSLAAVAKQGEAYPFPGTPAEAVSEVERRIREAIRIQKVADVPLGAFLSGGIDSSTIVAMMQAQSTQPVRTFSIGFAEERYDEAKHAAAVARHLGTDHTQLYVGPEAARAVIPRIADIWDEPFADSSQIPTYLVCSLARQKVKVALSGDGGDELFGGYERYFLTQDIWARTGLLSPRARRLARRLLMSLRPEQWDRVLLLAPRRFRSKATGDRLHKLAELIGTGSREDLYRLLVSCWKEPSTVVLGGHDPGPEGPPPMREFFAHMMLDDGLNYLPTDILTKVDRASMSVSLETRVPLLDHRVVEFAWQLPLEIKVRDGVGKWPLREILFKYVPRGLVERPKMGFAVPIDSWLRGPLRDWAEDLLAEARLRREGFFRPEPICLMWREHLSGRRQWHQQLWSVLMFQLWLELEEGRRASKGAGFAEAVLLK